MNQGQKQKLNYTLMLLPLNPLLASAFIQSMFHNCPFDHIPLCCHMCVHVHVHVQVQVHICVKAFLTFTN